MNAIDTNVLLYACDQRDLSKQQKALELVHDMVDGVIVWQVACEFINASRKLNDQGFTPAHAWERLAEFLDLFPLVPPSDKVLEKARELHLDRQWSFWDARIVAGCIEAGVTRLYSEDLPSGKAPAGLEIVNPFA